jgi:hypothetical protein
MVVAAVCMNGGVNSKSTSFNLYPASIKENISQHVHETVNISELQWKAQDL